MRPANIQATAANGPNTNIDQNQPHRRCDAASTSDQIINPAKASISKTVTGPVAGTRKFPLVECCTRPSFLPSPPLAREVGPIGILIATNGRHDN